MDPSESYESHMFVVQITYLNPSFTKVSTSIPAQDVQGHRCHAILSCNDIFLTSSHIFTTLPLRRMSSNYTLTFLLRRGVSQPDYNHGNVVPRLFDLSPFNKLIRRLLWILDVSDVVDDFLVLCNIP